MRRFTLNELKKMRTIKQLQFEDLKYSDSKVRIFLSRMTVRDGAKCDNLVTIQRYQNGNWVTVDRYQAK